MGKRKYILIVLFILAIVSIIIFFRGTLKKQPIGSIPESIDGKTESGQLLFSGIGVFAEKYTGYMSRADISDRFKAMVTEELPQMYSNLKNKDDKELSEYFKENGSILKDNYGFKDENDFISMIESLRNYKVNLNEYEKLSVDMDSFKDTSEKPSYSYVEYGVSYSNGNIIRFSTYISKKQSITPTFIVRIVE